MTKQRWTALIAAVVLLGAIVIGGVALAIASVSTTKQEQLISDLRADYIPVDDEKAIIAIIDDACPTLDTSYQHIDNLRSEGMTTEQAFDTIAIVRYSGYCK